ncbi:hypothetical protein CYY_006483 [Polysphondylium violaceum]|uniref:Nucleoside phosphorylase domain-containing protein n=1 Tax=Polysphondylium violaceum TaxID=133409 RepID=A0A8J4PRT9_9MYCE|nr:hypothetical protein CYY_006483 [Polysphondylium violaceum]
MDVFESRTINVPQEEPANGVPKKNVMAIVEENNSEAFQLAERFDRKIIGIDMESSDLYNGPLMPKFQVFALKVDFVSNTEIVITSTRGKTYMSIEVLNIVDIIQPTFVFFIGTCSGDSKACLVGDLLVVESSFKYDVGKKTNDGFKPEACSYKGRSSALSKMDSLNSRIDKEERVYNQEWLLKAIYEHQYENIDWFKEQNMEYNMKSLYVNQKVQNIIGCPDLLVSNGYLTSDSFELTDKGLKNVNIGEVYNAHSFQSQTSLAKYASGSAIEQRGWGTSDVFTELEERDCDVIGIDQDSSYFLEVVNQTEANFQCVVMKVVTDYANSEKQPDDIKNACWKIAAEYALDAAMALLSFYEPIIKEKEASPDMDTQ